MSEGLTDLSQLPVSDLVRSPDGVTYLAAHGMSPWLAIEDYDGGKPVVYCIFPPRQIRAGDKMLPVQTSYRPMFELLDGDYVKHPATTVQFTPPEADAFAAQLADAYRSLGNPEVF